MWLEKVDKTELWDYPNDTKCKLGFLDSVLRKWFYNPFTDEGRGKNIEKSLYECPNVLSFTAGIEMVLDTNEDFIATEIDKQKRKLRDISVALDQQHQLLRLIVQVD